MCAIVNIGTYSSDYGGRPDTLHLSDSSMHNSNAYHSTPISQPHTPGLNFGGHSQGMFMPHRVSMPVYGSGPVEYPGYPPMGT